MFRTLIYPSLGACDYSVELPHLSYCSWFDVCWSFGVVGLEWYPCCRLKYNLRCTKISGQRGKTVNAEFYEGVTDRLLKHIQRVRPAAFCSRDFFLLHDNSPAHTAANVCQFLTKKNRLQPFVSPRTLRQTIFCSSS